MTKWVKPHVVDEVEIKVITQFDIPLDPDSGG